MATILVLDDRPENRELLVTLLTHAGHRVFEAADGADGLALVRAQHPALVISDILMPTMDGYEFVRQLRADPSIATTEVIFSTAHYHERGARNLAIACGVSRVLAKPSEPEEVLRAVNQALAHQPNDPPAPVEGPFDREHLRLMTDKLSAKLDELQSTNLRLTALTAVSLDLALQRDPHTLLDQVCRDARDLIGARFAILCARDKTGSSNFHFASCGFDAATAAGLPRPGPDEAFFGEVPARRSSKTSGVTGLPKGYPAARSLLCAPIVSPHSIYGGICLLDKVGFDAFSDEDEGLLAMVAAQVGRIYENGNLYAELERKSDQLLESRERLSGLIESAMDAIVMIDERQCITLFNPAGETMFGYASGEVIGQSLDILIPRSFQAAHREQVRDYGDTGTTSRHMGALRTVKGLRKNGEVFLLEASISQDRSSGRLLYTAILRDSTERVRIQEEVQLLNTNLERRVRERTAELEAANLELEAFDYSISHDLRGPLARINGFATALIEDYGAVLDDKGRDFLHRIHNSGERMDRLVEDLLTLSTVSRGELHREDVDLGALAHSVLDTLKKADPGRNVETAVTPDLWTRADPGLLRIVLDNLLGNAWKFTSRRDDARIEVTSRQEEGETTFVVHDNGAGFDPANAGKLFAPFRRLHDRDEFEGTGIGLATVRRIINRHGGKVSASGAVDQGATFTFTLGVVTGKS